MMDYGSALTAYLYTLAFHSLLNVLCGPVLKKWFTVQWTGDPGIHGQFIPHGIFF